MGLGREADILISVYLTLVLDIQKSRKFLYPSQERSSGRRLRVCNSCAFSTRQKRILIDEDYFFADLVFYHRILKCHIIVELKIDKFRHEYASQLNMYLNYFKAEVMQPDDNPPIGILLCTEKGDTLVKYATAGLDPNIFVQKYRIELPSEEEIKNFISSTSY